MILSLINKINFQFNGNAKKLNN